MSVSCNARASSGHVENDVTTKVVVTTRLLNDRVHVDRFCRAYAWADLIVVPDGGSTDGGDEVAAGYPNVIVVPFHEMAVKGGIWRNPEGKHINLGLDIAEAYRADWIIHDDIDSAPTMSLGRDAHSIFEESPADVIFVPRLYIYGTDKYFPFLTGGEPPFLDMWKGFWGWRTEAHAPCT